MAPTSPRNFRPCAHLAEPDRPRIAEVPGLGL